MLSSQRNVQDDQLGSINPQQDMDFPVKFQTGLHKDSSIVCLKSISGLQHANQDRPRAAGGRTRAVNASSSSSRPSEAATLVDK